MIFLTRTYDKDNIPPDIMKKIRFSLINEYAIIYNFLKFKKFKFS